MSSAMLASEHRDLKRSAARTGHLLDKCVYINYTYIGELKGIVIMNRIEGFSGYFRYLSNFYKSVVEMDGHIYTTVEHAYQAAKTLDEEERQKIRSCLTPHEAKQLGQKIELRTDWEDIKLNVMEELIRQKFTVHETLKEALLLTEGYELEETNTWGDTYWGVCNGIGENHLGRLLMKIRDELVETRNNHVSEI